MNYIHFILFTVFTNAAAQIMLKYGMTNLGAIQMVSPVTIPAVVLTIFKVVFSPWVFAGLLTFVISMASHLYVLTKVELSFAYPFLSLAYVAVAIIAWLVFSEDLNAWRIAVLASFASAQYSSPRVAPKNTIHQQQLHRQKNLNTWHQSPGSNT